MAHFLDLLVITETGQDFTLFHSTAQQNKSVDPAKTQGSLGYPPRFALSR